MASIARGVLRQAKAINGVRYASVGRVTQVIGAVVDVQVSFFSLRPGLSLLFCRPLHGSLVCFPGVHLGL